MSADTRKPQDCGCAYEFVEDGAVLRKRWFHEPGCALAAGVGVPPDEDSDECQRCGMPGHLCECDSGSAPAKERQDARARVLSDIAQERGLQDSKWGGSEHDDTHTSNNWTFWLDLIDEHTRKAFSTEGLYTAYPNARHRLIEVAALAAAAVESFDRAMGYDEPPAGVGEARPAEPPDDIRICLQPRHRELEDECGRLRERLADTETEKIERGTEILRLREQLDALAVQRDDLQRELRRPVMASPNLRVARRPNYGRRQQETTVRNHFTPTQAQAKVRDPEYLAEIRRRMRDDPIGRANVPPEIVTALIDALETARESNRHNFAVARAALGVVGPPPNQTTDEVGALGQTASESRGGES